MKWRQTGRTRWDSSVYTVQRHSERHFSVSYIGMSLMAKLYGVASSLDGAKKIAARHQAELGR